MLNRHFYLKNEGYPLKYFSIIIFSLNTQQTFLNLKRHNSNTKYRINNVK